VAILTLPTEVRRQQEAVQSVPQMPQQLVSRKRPAPPAAQEIESPLAVDNSAECTPPTNARFRRVSPCTSSPTDSRTPESPRNAYASNDSGTNDCTVQCGARIDTHNEHTFTDSPVLYNVPETWLLQP